MTRTSLDRLHTAVAGMDARLQPALPGALCTAVTVAVNSATGMPVDAGNIADTHTIIALLSHTPGGSSFSGCEHVLPECGVEVTHISPALC
jgi:hypothetical protein